MSVYLTATFADSTCTSDRSLGRHSCLKYRFERPVHSVHDLEHRVSEAVIGMSPQEGLKLGSKRLNVIVKLPNVVGGTADRTGD